MAELKAEIGGLYAIVGGWMAQEDGPDRLRAAIRGGAQVVQLRAKDVSTRDLLEMARTVRSITWETGTTFIVNDRLDVALASGADGVHLGPEDLPVHEARRIAGPGLIIGASAGDPETARRLEGEGAGYLGSGPVYPTDTKPDTRAVIGPDGLARVTEAVGIPVVGIGGIDPERARQVMAAGARGVAVISALFHAHDPEARAREFVARLSAPS